MEMMCKYFWKLNFFLATDTVVGDMSVSQRKKREEKKQSWIHDLRPTLAQPEMFSSIGHFFKSGDFFGSSPTFAFSQFHAGIDLKPVETRQ